MIMVSATNSAAIVLRDRPSQARCGSASPNAAPAARATSRGPASFQRVRRETRSMAPVRATLTAARARPSRPCERFSIAESSNEPGSATRRNHSAAVAAPTPIRRGSVRTSRMVGSTFRRIVPGARAERPVPAPPRAAPRSAPREGPRRAARRRRWAWASRSGSVMAAPAPDASGRPSATARRPSPPTAPRSRPHRSRVSPRRRTPRPGPQAPGWRGAAPAGPRCADRPWTGAARVGRCPRPCAPLSQVGAVRADRASMGERDNLGH